MGVDEGVSALAIGTVGNKGAVELSGNLGGELGTILVVGEVEVGGVMGVDEGVAVGVLLNLVVFRDDDRGLGDGLGPGGLLDWGLDREVGGGLWAADLNRGNGLFDGLSNEGGGISAGGGDVTAVQDPESIFAGAVLDGVSLAIVTDVRVLAHPVSGSVGFFPEDDLVLGGKSSTGTSVAGIETLLLDNLGVPLVEGLGCATTGRDGTR